MTEWDILNAALRYEPDTGVFTWRSDAHCRKAGQIAGSFNDQGYWRIKVAGKQYRANRLAYFLMMKEWPKHEVDHINGVRDDNRWSNLRQAARVQNEANKPAYNPLGVKGVRKQGHKYGARIRIGDDRVYLGTFDTQEEAAAAYQGASRVAHGAFTRGPTA